MREPPDSREPRGTSAGSADPPPNDTSRPARPTELARTVAVGSDEDWRVTQAAGASEPRAVDPSPHSFEPRNVSSRYEQKRLLGEGGMGAVHLCSDAWIGREVALKVIRDRRHTDSGTLGRFIREARVQGQLEHPSIVPVYDIGARSDGAAYFTILASGACPSSFALANASSTCPSPSINL